MHIEGRKRQNVALVQSMPRVSNNYGGLLQAYALQRVLRNHDVNAYTNTEIAMRGSLRSSLRSVGHFIRHRSLDARISPEIWRYRGEHLTHFAAANLQTMNPTFSSAAMSKAVDILDADYAIAGSDQVWRPRYTDVLAGSFESIESGRVRKIAYAASFGLANTNEFNPALRERFGRALKDFSFVGVRELAAVEICLEEFGVEAEHVLDPTLLILPGQWAELTDSSGMSDAREAEPYLLYIGLDHDRAARQESQRLASRLGLVFHEIYGPEPVSRKDFRRNPASFLLPTVEEWISSIMDASMVVTDSFHVSAFSIMFEVPFLVMKNSVRGNSRLDSLLQTFDLLDQLKTSEMLHDIKSVPTIHWSGVRERLGRNREKSEMFLQRALDKH